MAEEQVLQEAYSLIARLWCSPPEAEAERLELKTEAEEVVAKLADVDEESAGLLAKFLDEDAILEEDYVDLFELDPQCPLYLGSHSYDEPKTCAGAAVSDRNDYMIELVGIYNHFGRKPNGRELPDYLPMMVDFLALTAESRDDPVRAKLIEEYFLPFLPPMRAKLGELNTPYINLLDALEKVIGIERKVESHVG
ncbi:MAG: molecular chaperone TorD family protein [Alphaproteobacteria bacterium]|jgi:nitrate reductase delta subunit|nr:molecular chaperone TorD family protein [Alphaproteobacteria bacterium]|tara:strand:- start:126 stop:710 length:585 start_codon:yes stop_codon:yes gene_type:complete